MKQIHSMYLVAVGAEVITFLILALMGVWLFWPYKTIEFKDVPPDGAKVLNSGLHPGDILLYRSSFCKYTNDTATIHRTLIDGQIVVLTDIVGSFPKGCYKDKIVASTAIPETANPGTYQLALVHESHPNPLRTIQVRYHTEYFLVTPSPATFKVKIDGEPAVIEINK